MIQAQKVFNQNDGDVTKSYYATMNAKGLLGQLAVALFRAQKRSTAAKKYRGKKFRHAAYDVKNWSLSEVCRIMNSLNAFGYEFKWGWGKDPNTPGFPWVLYVEIPTGQVSFHSPDRLNGPDYPKGWDGIGASEPRILAFCDSLWSKEK
jgi:hypothetical protein